MSASTAIRTRLAAASRLLEAARARRWTGPAATAVLALVAALATAVAMPRGPVTSEQGLAVIATGLVLGLAVAFAWPSRWATLAAFGVFVVVFEVARRDTVGPSTGGLRFDSVFGILAFIVGRGLHYLLFGVALVAGGSIGRLLVRRFAAERPPSRGLLRTILGAIPRTVAILLTFGLAALVAMPPSAPPVLGSDGKPAPGSIAELTTIRLGGVDQAISIRAADPNKPVLLYLSGGPGQSDVALSRVLSQPWVHDFVFVDWDQRGNGKSYAAIDPVSTFTLAGAVDDTNALAEYLRRRFDEKKIYLMGESWGTILGVLAVQKRPDLYYAWIGSGQMVDIVETDQRIYDDLVAYAKSKGDGDLQAKLAAIGRPPYRDLPWANANMLFWYDYLYKEYTPSEGYRARGEASGLDDFGMMGSEYSLIEKANVLRGLIDTFTIMYPQLYGIDFRRDVPSLQVPVYILDGKAELAGRRDLMLEWYEKLQAPSKQRVEFEDAAHSVAFEQADEVLKLLTGTIVPATYGK